MSRTSSQPLTWSRLAVGLLAIVGGLALVAVAVVAGTGSGHASRPAFAATSPTSGATVTTTATGKVTAVPDNLEADLTIHTTGSTATAVLNDNNARVQSLLSNLKAGGIDDKDVQTTGLNLGATFDNHGHITGYAADDSLSITFRDLKKAGAQLDALVASAGDAVRVDGVSFGFNDEDSMTAAARTDAVKLARAQASTMADAAGAKLGAVRSITEITAPTSPVFAGNEIAAPAAGSGAVAVPLAAGSDDITVQVKVVFALT